MIVIGALVAPIPAMAGSGASSGFQVSARIPVQCNLSAETFSMEAGESLMTGQVMESCNSGRGFEIMASHRALQGGERVRVQYGDAQARLNQSGLSRIAFRAGARHGPVPVRVSTAQLERALMLSFSMTAV